MFHLGYIFSFFLLFAVLTSAVHKFPSDIKRCTYSDSDCLSKVVTNILHTHASKGHRGLNIIPFDPLHLKSLILEKIPGSPVNIEFKFKNIDLIGIKEGTVVKLTGFTKEASDLVFEMQVEFPKIVLTGPYSVDGRVLILPITGEGNSKIVFDNMTVTAKAKCTTKEKDGKVYLNIVDVKLDLQPKRVTFNLENLFNGDKALGDNMNQVLNDNWDVVFSELKPLVDEALAKIAMHISNGTFSKIPYDDLFLQSE